MIVTAAHAIMMHTQKMKKRCRTLSFSEHSGKRQWEIWKKINEIKIILCDGLPGADSFQEAYHKLLVSKILVLAQLTTRRTVAAAARDLQPFLKLIGVRI